MKSFRKVLVANRGEIALRVMQTCRRMGLGTVAVFSDADERAPHVRFADEAVRLGPAPSRESYLRVDRILDAAKRTGADAVHPGYGFLSENPDFAAELIAAGLVFIGPPPDAIRAMGRKREAKALVEKHGYPQLTPQVKAKIFGLNAARLFNVDPRATRNAIRTDKLSQLREEYQTAPQPANTQYGWVWRGRRRPALPIG